MERVNDALAGLFQREGGLAHSLSGPPIQHLHFCLVDCVTPHDNSAGASLIEKSEGPEGCALSTRKGFPCEQKQGEQPAEDGQ